MIMDDNDGQMIFGDPGGLKLPDICLTDEEKPWKNLTMETCPDRDRTRARYVTDVHGTTCPTAVDSIAIELAVPLTLKSTCIYVLYSIFQVIGNWFLDQDHYNPQILRYRV